MSEVTGEDIERLANRMAMLVSDDGEADNAGRAVGQLARRLGLSGGDLKQIVLAGAGGGYRPGSSPGMARLEQEIATLRRALAQAEEAARAARQDREALTTENAQMRVSIYRQRASRKLQRLLLGVGLILVAVVAAGMLWFGPNLFDPPRRVEILPAAPVARPDGPAVRVALVRKAGATLYRRPDHESEVIGRLAPGTKLLVQRTDWSKMLQWAQVEVEGHIGYVPSTEIDMF